MRRKWLTGDVALTDGTGGRAEVGKVKHRVGKQTDSDGASILEGTPTAALEENVEAIKAWERESLLSRSRAEQIADWIAGTGAGGPVLVLHVLWFGLWVSANVGWIPGVTPFDPFPFPFLTMVVALEAIVVAWFVLASQNRLARQSDRRSHVNLQVDLLAEREMTAVLQLLQDIARHLNVSTTVTPEQLRDLAKKTDLRNLTDRTEEITDAAPPAEPVQQPR
jgi:uncharacterized membrane protein